MAPAIKTVVGLTGGIGSGKSAAADEFARHGAAIVDTDRIAHALTGATGAAIGPISAVFGKHVIAPDGALDREVMRRTAFTDSAARAQLEAILHPLIRVESARQVAHARADPGIPYIVLVVPLLVESGAYTRDSGLVSRVCVVDCAPATQLERVKRRSGLGTEQIQRIMAAQATREERLQVADDIIDNDGDFDSLRTQVARLDRLYRTINGTYPFDAPK